MDYPYIRFAVGLVALSLMLRPLETTAQDQYSGVQGPITNALIDCEIAYQKSRLQSFNELLDAGFATVREVRRVEEALVALRRQRDDFSQSRKPHPVHVTLGDMTRSDGTNRSVMLILPGFQPGQAGRELLISGQLADAPAVNYQQLAEQDALRLEKLFLYELLDRLNDIDDGSESIANEMSSVRHKIEMVELQQSALKSVSLLHAVDQLPVTADSSMAVRLEVSLQDQQRQRNDIAQQVRDHEHRLLDRMARVAELKRVACEDKSFERELSRERILEQVAKAELAVQESRARENELRLRYLMCLTESASDQQILQAVWKIYEAKQHLEADVALAHAHVDYLGWKQTAFHSLRQVDAATWKEWRLAELEWKTAQKRVQMLRDQQVCASDIVSWLTQIIDQQDASVTQIDRTDAAPNSGESE